MKQRLELMMSVVVLICACILAKTSAVYVTGRQVEEQSCIVVDVGHGGFDSGKIGVNGVLEKDINLQVALKLKETLEAKGVSVIMTREDDQGLYDEHASNKKAQDMQRRCELINEKKPLMTVSIHQNSYKPGNQRGAGILLYNIQRESKAGGNNPKDVN